MKKFELFGISKTFGSTSLITTMKAPDDFTEKNLHEYRGEEGSEVFVESYTLIPKQDEPMVQSKQKSFCIGNEKNFGSIWANANPVSMKIKPELKKLTKLDWKNELEDLVRSCCCWGDGCEGHSDDVKKILPFVEKLLTQAKAEQREEDARIAEKEEFIPFNDGSLTSSMKLHNLVCTDIAIAIRETK